MAFVGTKKIFFLLFVLFLIVLFSFLTMNEAENNGKNSLLGNKNMPERGSVAVKNTRISVDIADTPEKRTLGLSGRPSLALDEGMFFIFDTPWRFSFWMKDMNFPIDIIWIDAEFKVADITKNAVPASFPKIFEPRTPVLYVLETVAGWADKNGIKIGDKVLFSRQ